MRRRAQTTPPSSPGLASGCANKLSTTNSVYIRIAALKGTSKRDSVRLCNDAAKLRMIEKELRVKHVVETLARGTGSERRIPDLTRRVNPVSVDEE